MFDTSRKKLLEDIHDVQIIKNLYLDLTVEQLINKLHNIQITSLGDNALVPFMAAIRGYVGAEDSEGNSWLLKEIGEEEVLNTKIQEIAYYMDFLLDTLAAPSFILTHDAKYYRATKNIQNAMQIGSYNYLEKPYLKILANDLINRWLLFDEDRNPNNYLVLWNSKEVPFVVAIDYNRADLVAEGMKIKGNKSKFGWHREENTRFLTLLKPENFADLSIEDFSGRLEKLMSIEEEQIRSVCYTAFNDVAGNNKKVIQNIVSNLVRRRTYINNYFRTWFKAEKKKNDKHNVEYGTMGKSFIEMHKRR